MVPFRDRLFLVVAGQAKQGTSIGGLQHLAEELGLAHSVKWFPFYIPDPEVANYFELCDWVAMPYSSLFTSQSGVLNVAVAHCRPVLASGLPTFREVFEVFPLGIMVRPDDRQSLTAGIHEMMEVWGSFSAAAFKAAGQAFSWERNVAVSSGVYCQLAQSLRGALVSPAGRSTTKVCSTR